MHEILVTMICILIMLFTFMPVRVTLFKLSEFNATYAILSP